MRVTGHGKCGIQLRGPLLVGVNRGYESKAIMPKKANKASKHNQGSYSAESFAACSSFNSLWEEPPSNSCCRANQRIFVCLPPPAEDWTESLAVVDTGTSGNSDISSMRHWVSTTAWRRLLTAESSSRAHRLLAMYLHRHQSIITS